jgi:hypothetical protein
LLASFDWQSRPFAVLQARQKVVAARGASAQLIAQLIECCVNIAAVTTAIFNIL